MLIFLKVGNGILVALVCLAPIASAIVLAAYSPGVIVGLLMGTVLFFHFLSLVWVAIDVFKRKNVPYSKVVLVTRLWTFASIGLFVLLLLWMMIKTLLGH